MEEGISMSVWCREHRLKTSLIPKGQSSEEQGLLCCAKLRRSRQATREPSTRSPLTHLNGGDLASVGGLPPITGSVPQMIDNTPGIPRNGCHTLVIHRKFLVKQNIGFYEGRIVKF